jgi:hypothetical protein
MAVLECLTSPLECIYNSIPYDTNLISLNLYFVKLWTGDQKYEDDHII